MLLQLVMVVSGASVFGSGACIRLFHLFCALEFLCGGPGVMDCFG